MDKWKKIDGWTNEWLESAAEVEKRHVYCPTPAKMLIKSQNKRRRPLSTELHSGPEYFLTLYGEYLLMSSENVLSKGSAREMVDLPWIFISPLTDRVPVCAM